MRARKTYAAALLLAVAVGYAAGVALHTGSMGRGTVEAGVILQVYRNGQLVYEKHGDPALANMAAFLGEMFDNDWNNPSGTNYQPQAILMSGSNGLWIYLKDGWDDESGHQKPKGVIIFGEDTGVARSDYTMQTVHGIVLIDEFNLINNDTGVGVTVGATYTNPADATSNVTISAVGLGVYAHDSSTPSAGYTWMLLKDVLGTPVVLQPGDSIHVRYTILFP